MPAKNRRFVRPRAAAVIALMDRGLEGDTSSQHRFRVAARSLKAGLPMLLPTARRRQMRAAERDLRRAIRAFADSRDLDVARGLLTARRRGPHAAPSRPSLLSLLDQDRKRALRKCRKEWPHNLDRRLKALLDQQEPRLPTMKRRTGREILKRQASALLLVRSLNRFDPIRLHNLRKAIRRLRYAVELLEDLSSRPRARRRPLEALQKQLGEAQDRVVLSRWLTRHARRLGRRDPPLARALRHEAARQRACGVAAWAEFRRLAPVTVLERLTRP